VGSGRVTVDSVHYARTATRFVPLGQTEFARDHSFGSAASDLRAWVEEKTGGRIAASPVGRITLADLCDGGVAAAATILAGVRDGLPVVVDAASDGDLRVLETAFTNAGFMTRTSARVSARSPSLPCKSPTLNRGIWKTRQARLLPAHRRNERDRGYPVGTHMAGAVCDMCATGAKNLGDDLGRRAESTGVSAVELVAESERLNLIRRTSSSTRLRLS
jgi:hypothetical protein